MVREQEQSYSEIKNKKQYPQNSKNIRHIKTVFFKHYLIQNDPDNIEISLFDKFDKLLEINTIPKNKIVCIHMKTVDNRKMITIDLLNTETFKIPGVPNHEAWNIHNFLIYSLVDSTTISSTSTVSKKSQKKRPIRKKLVKSPPPPVQPPPAQPVPPPVRPVQQPPSAQPVQPPPVRPSIKKQVNYCPPPQPVQPPIYSNLYFPAVPDDSFQTPGNEQNSTTQETMSLVAI